jgi:predicted small metal-binding protein
MAKEIRCADIVPGCTFTARAETQDELMQKVVEHAKAVHHLDPVPPEVAAKAQAAIREVSG